MVDALKRLILSAGFPQNERGLYIPASWDWEKSGKILLTGIINLYTELLAQHSPAVQILQDGMHSVRLGIRLPDAVSNRLGAKRIVVTLTHSHRSAWEARGVKLE